MSVDGDVLFFHFSGHGTQIPDRASEESDGKDEAICPTDMNVIADDDLRALFKPLEAKPRVKFTFIAGALRCAPWLCATTSAPAEPSCPQIVLHCTAYRAHHTTPLQSPPPLPSHHITSR